ncbi:MAG: FtsX-like permease family protein [Nitrospira sp.]|nr:FtsX-like permease family protein [Nitrospira sp.]MBP0121605.1 FtsX-like permease family protein [Nitrospira sp.]MBP0123755.1 FtsX-like permease family protein [Nitrospira sp.]MBP0126700.1 FtsX-like permease family protein [Nitrospira sp.]MBP0131260.1 FtsX-like permease family protein [Nitrospira sp.]
MTIPLGLHIALIRAHVSQKRFRVLLSIAGVALGVLASVAIGTANIHVLRSFEQAVTTVAGPASLEIAGHDLGLDESVITAIRAVEGVVSAAPVIEDSVVLTQGKQRGQGLQIVGLDLLAEAGSRGFQIQADAEEALEALLAPDSLYLGRQVAADWNLGVGSLVEVTVGGRLVQLRVAGLLHNDESRSSLWDRLAVMDIAAAQQLLHSVGRLDRIELVTQPGRPLDEIAASVRSVLPPHLVVQRPAQRTEQVQNMVRAFQLNLTVLSWVGLLVGMFLIYNTMAFAVAQRRREIGIYRALGMTEQRVAALFLLEAGLLGLLGGLIGGLAGVWLGRGLVSLVSRTISDLYAPVTSGWMILPFDLSTFLAVAKGLLLGTLVSMLGALGPSLDAGRTVTVRALAPGDYEIRNQLRAGLFGWISLALLLVAGFCSLMGPVQGLPLFGYLATGCLLGALSCLAPVCIQSLGWRSCNKSKTMALGGSLRLIAVDQASRHPGRNAVTVSALMVGLSIMIGVAVMVRSFRDTVEVWVNETVMADLIVAPQSWLQGKQVGQSSRSLPGTWLATLSAIEGVAAVDTYREVHLEIKGQRVSVVSRDLLLHAQRSRYLMVHGDSTVLLNRAAKTGGVLLSEVLATRLELHEGSQVSIMTQAGPVTLPVEGIFYDYATDGGKMVMDRAWYQRHWQDDWVTVFPVYLADGADAKQVRQSIVTQVAGLDGVTVPPLVIRNHELRKKILDIFDRTFVLTYVLEAIAVLVAVLGIINTLVTAVLERRREFATLRAIGASVRQVERLVLWEAAYLGLIGAVLGVVGGLLLALLLIHVVNKQSFGWTIQMTVPGGVIFQAVALALASALVAGYWPARWAARQPLVEGLREE